MNFTWWKHRPNLESFPGKTHEVHYCEFHLVKKRSMCDVFGLWKCRRSWKTTTRKWLQRAHRTKETINDRKRWGQKESIREYKFHVIFLWSSMCKYCRFRHHQLAFYTIWENLMSTTLQFMKLLSQIMVIVSFGTKLTENEVAVKLGLVFSILWIIMSLLMWITSPYFLTHVEDRIEMCRSWLFTCIL